MHPHPVHLTKDKMNSNLNTSKNRDKKESGKQQVPSLAFRGFNTVKAAKIPVKETARLN